MTKKVTVNGKPLEVEADTVAELLAELGKGQDPDGLAVALNDAVLPRARWRETTLLESAEIDILEATQGG